MNRFRTTEEPGVWKLTHETEPRRKITLEIFDGPGMRRRMIEIVADGGVYIDGKVIMSAMRPRRLASKTTVPVDLLAREIGAIALEVSNLSGVSVDDMRGKSQKPRISQARKVAIFLAERRLHISHVDVGAFFGRSREVVSNHVIDVERQCRAAAPEPHGIVEESKTF